MRTSVGVSDWAGYSLCYTLRMPDAERPAVVRKILEKKGYVFGRISGSRHIFVKAGYEPVSIPVQGGKVKPAYVRKAEKAP